MAFREIRVNAQIWATLDNEPDHNGNSWLLMRNQDTGDSVSADLTREQITQLRDACNEFLSNSERQDG